MTRAIDVPNLRISCGSARTWVVTGLVCCAAFVAAPALAAGWVTFPVDDSLSIVQAPAAQLRWRTTLPSKESGDLLDATMEVRIVLNVKPWVDMPARVYMVMPPQPQSSLAVQWTTGGTLLAGRLTGGQRQLVFQGVIPGARLEDAMRVIVSANAGDPVTPQRVNFRFEIEVPSR